MSRLRQRHRHTGLEWSALLLAAAALGVAGEVAHAQDAWSTVVTVVPAVELPPASDVPAARLRAKRALRETGSLPVPPPPPSQTPVSAWDGLPPLATLATRTAATAEAAREAAPATDGDVRLAREYCLNVADPAADARFVWQKKVIADLEQQIAKRVELLETKTAEYQKWLARRDEFSKRAQEAVVTIYSRMRPDAAAAQLVAMDEETAAAVVTKLDPKNASAILNEMEPAQAARLTAIISGASNIDIPGKTRARPGDKKS
jgi:flagellar motility protein MotE (MotC chaperone)